MKAGMVDDRPTMGAVPAVPVKSATCGLPGPESVTVIWAVRVGGVIEAGVKVTLIVHLLRAGREPSQLSVSVNSALSTPVTAMLLMVRVALLSL